MPVKGLWNVGGVNLPDFGISEKLGIGPNNSAVMSPNWESSTTTDPFTQNWLNTQNQSQTSSNPQYSPATNLVTGQPSTPLPTNSPPPSNGGGNPSPRTMGDLPVNEQEKRKALGLGPNDDIGAYWQRQQEEQAKQQELDNQRRGEINSGYNDYFSTLDRMMNEGLPQQAEAQRGIIGSQYQQGVSDLTAQNQLDLRDISNQRGDVKSNQVSNLKDLAENINQLFNTGQVKLGAMGAGDSSAANQYAYALTKLGNKSRGNLMTQSADAMKDIDTREFKLKTILNNENQRLSREKDQSLQGISQWFAEQKNAIQQAVASGKIAQGKDLAALTTDALNQAMQAAQQANQYYQNQTGMLQQWALNNSTTIKQAREKMASIAGLAPNLPQYGGLGQVDFQSPQVSTSAPVGYGYGRDDKERLFR